MIRIAEKLGFMKVRVVKVCAKSGVGRKMGHKNNVFVQIHKKKMLKDQMLDSSR